MTGSDGRPDAAGDAGRPSRSLLGPPDAPKWVAEYLTLLEQACMSGDPDTHAAEFVASWMRSHEVDAAELDHHVARHVDHAVARMQALRAYGSRVAARREGPVPVISWTPYLARPWTAPNGIVLSFPGDLDSLLSLGYRLGNGLRKTAEARRQAGLAATGHVQFVAATESGVPLWCSEVVPTASGPVLRTDVTRPRVPCAGLPECREAFGAMLEAVADGRLRPALAARGDRFVALG